MGHPCYIMDLICPLGTFCPLGRFVLWDVLSLGTFCPWDVMSLIRYVPWDVLSLGRFVPGTFWPWDVLSLGPFVLGGFVCASQKWCLTKLHCPKCSFRAPKLWLFLHFQGCSKLLLFILKWTNHLTRSAGPPHTIYGVSNIFIALSAILGPLKLLLHL